MRGEYGKLDYDPASISYIGCAIANAGRMMHLGAQYIAEHDWEGAVMNELILVAEIFKIAYMTDEDFNLSQASDNLEKACKVRGCIMMASAATTDLRNCYRSMIDH